VEKEKDDKRKKTEACNDKSTKKDTHTTCVHLSIQLPHNRTPPLHKPLSACKRAVRITGQLFH